ncbi:MAG: transglutaminase domain-containing protein [Bacteroidales bacterium]|nr:transglutaminase domain-containing protein [Bacteroidales bacterium]
MKRTLLLLLICAFSLNILTAQSFTKKQALDFLYTYMPQSDRADYDTAFFKMQVDYAFLARETFSWGKTIPDDIFKHFVLVYRVNNEDLDTARAFIFHQLRDRVKNMSMYDAALEVNHWCHEYVDYQPADVRTSAPLATIRTSHGRCGEESTLTVTAMRAVGIPARQCYTPRWAHCDDNHAWVEVWVNGKWWFLGACEPSPDLDMGWFAYPSTRTMMVHTNVFGDYKGPEEVNKKTQYYSCINVLSNYADTVRMTITVVDENQKPIKDALVRFKLYNYAEYYTLAAKRTDENGKASLITGKGDLLIWVSKENLFNYSKMDGRIEHEKTIVLSPNKKYDASDLDIVEVNDFTIVPPYGDPTLPEPDSMRNARCEERKAKEDAMRERYRSTYPTKESLKDIHNEYFSDEEFYDVIKRSEGNHAEILAFLQKHSTKEPGLYLKEFVAALADKDLRDTKAETLEKQLTFFREGKYPLDVYFKGILPARISNELIRDWRRVMSHGFGLFHDDRSVKAIHDFVKKSIKVDNDCNYYNCPISPIGVLRYNKADAHSRDIFFVALCRALDVPAYMDNSNGDLWAWENGQWHLVTFDEVEQPAVEYKTLILKNDEHRGYYTQYTLQRFENGEYVSFDFENDPRVETNPIVLSVPAGHYCLSLGDRNSDGSVKSQFQFFDVYRDTTIMPIFRLKSVRGQSQYELDEVYGKVDLKKTKISGESLASILKESGKEHVIICLGTPGTEPVNHLMKEMAAQQSEFESWNGPIYFIVKEGIWKSEKGQPRNLHVLKDGYDSLSSQLKTTMDKEINGLNPMCYVIDKKGAIIFFSEGYNIGTPNMMLKLIKR